MLMLNIIKRANAGNLEAIQIQPMLMLNEKAFNSKAFGVLIQIQPMLMLNPLTRKLMAELLTYSNTTYVNVKRQHNRRNKKGNIHSNTTYVNVKLPLHLFTPCNLGYSNTTYVNVKLWYFLVRSDYMYGFKYNLC